MIDRANVPQFAQANAPRSIRAVNWLGRTLRDRGLTIPQLSEESILRAARRRTGLDDWGDEHFREPLRILLDSLDHEADLSLLGRAFFRQMCVEGVANRLKIQQELNQHPEIRDVPIERPLFILGWPRTGTTLLHHLLSLDANHRVLRLFELLEPSPLPSKDALHTTDRRIQILRRRMRRLNKLSPTRSAIHSSDAESPEECALLLRNSFATQMDVVTEIPSYSEWLRSADMTETYKYYRLQLQLLSLNTPGRRLVLKAPRHLWSLDALLRVFPDACIVQTHRHPFKSLPSACSLSAVQRQFLTEYTDFRSLGNKMESMFAEGMEHAWRSRKAAPAEQFHDIIYEDVIADPGKAVRGIYDRFGDHCPAALDARIGDWIENHPRNRHGVHRYTLEEFGLTEAGVSERFADYLHRHPLSVV